MGSNSIQFRGLEAVVKAYENREIVAWSHWCGTKQMLNKFEGTDIAEGSNALREWLTMLEGATNAIYTLKVYEDPPAGKIKDTTPCDGSFNFRLDGDDNLATQSSVTRYIKTSQLEQEVVSMKSDISDIKKLLTEEGEETEEDEKDTWDKIGNILDKPNVSKLLGHIFKVDLQSDPGKVSGIDNDQLIKKAVEKLKTMDHKLGEHLWKLANLDPITFQAIIGKLETL